MKKRIYIIFIIILIFSFPFLYNSIKIHKDMFFEIYHIKKILNSFTLNENHIKTLKGIKYIGNNSKNIINISDINELPLTQLIKLDNDIDGIRYQYDDMESNICFINLNKCIFDKKKIKKVLLKEYDGVKHYIKKEVLNSELSIIKRQCVLNSGTINGFNYFYYINYTPLPANSWDEKEAHLFVYTDKIFISIRAQQVGTKNLGAGQLRKLINKIKK
ncbi:hypothetical protein [Anaerofustis stercorihominis]|uniref:hypothetical protein n=1 Tax=Anaerofustis stercorihominis TaxID=214853 RepID=UPI00214C3DD3|nr:hypothetical protein [Anaerofustis stercorihominis]MCR2033423.1 hypothetical protein [Anaerofustis stercorihominis]